MNHDRVLVDNIRFLSGSIDSVVKKITLSDARTTFNSNSTYYSRKPAPRYGGKKVKRKIRQNRSPAFERLWKIARDNRVQHKREYCSGHTLTLGGAERCTTEPDKFVQAILFTKVLIVSPAFLLMMIGEQVSTGRTVSTSGLSFSLSI